MKRLKSLSIHIELNRQRLQRAMNDQDATATKTAQFQLTTLQAEFYEETRKALGMRPTDLVLLFSEATPCNGGFVTPTTKQFGGEILTQAEYLIRLSKMSETDLNTHTAVPVDEAMVVDLSLIVRRTS